MKNRKGYTLIELLGTILIIGLLLLIGIPTIRKYINRGTNVYYTSLEREMKTAGSEYLNTYRTLLPRVIGHSTVISLEEVVANNYIDPVVDESGNECTGQIMAVKRKKDGYDYYACLKCGTKYISGDDMCKVDTASNTGFGNNELDNPYDDSDSYRVVFDTYDYTVGQSEEFILPTGRVEHLENGEWKEINAEPVVSTKKVDTNSLGTKTVTYSYHGSKTEIRIDIVDKVAPSKPETVIKYESANGNDYQGNWYSGKLYVEFKSTDYTKKNVLGSGIKNYEYSIDGVNWIEVRRDNDPSKEYTDWLIIDPNALDNKVIPDDGEYIIKVRAKDKNDNVSEVNTFTIRIDTKAPDCKLKVTGDVGLEGWYKSGITIDYDLSGTNGTASGILTTPIVARRANGTIITTGTDRVTINTPEENIRVYGTITDQAGNVTVCEAPDLSNGFRIKLDPRVPEAPTITVTDGNGVGGRWYTGNNPSNPDEYVTTPDTNVWHIDDVTMTLSGANNLSKNIYFYTIDSDVAIDSTGRATNANGTFDNRNVAAANIKAVQSQNTTGTTYYMKVCSVSGNCSETSTYIVKLDKTTPAAPTFTAVDSNPLQGIWHMDDSNTSTTPVSGAWHIVDTTLNLSGANNISGNIYNYAPNTALTADSNGRPNGTRGTSTTIATNTPTAGTTYYGMVCSVAGKCSDNGSFLLKIDKTTPTAPTITVTDGNGAGGRWYTGNNPSNPDEYVTTPNTNVWHINDTTMTFGGGSNVSGNLYYYKIDGQVEYDIHARATNSANNNTKVASTVAPVQSQNTTGTTYYGISCSVAGKCSDNSNYIVKLDKTTPAAPTFTATDGNPLGNLWHIDATRTSSTPVSGVWHIDNTTLSLSGANNISGNIYNFAPNTALTVTAGRPNGTRGTSTGAITANTPAAGTTYYGMVCSIAGRCSSNSNYVLKIDKTVPNAPTMTATDNKGNNQWHYQSVTVNLTNGGNVSGNIYTYRNGADITTNLGRATVGSNGSPFVYNTATAGTTYYAKACSVAGKCGNSSNYTFKVDTTAPITSNFHAIDGDTAEASCSDPESGVVSGTVRVSINASTITATCTNGAGGTSSASHNCGYNGCKYGHNTCAYGCDKVWNACHVAAWCEGGYDTVTTPKTCQNKSCSACGQSCSEGSTVQCGHGTVNDHYGFTASCSCTTSYYSCPQTSQVWNDCHVIHPCEGAYEDKNCSSCKTGENTCRGGYTW